MPKGWVKLTKRNDDPIIVNLAHVSSLEPNDKGYTRIWFSAGHEDGNVNVQETPAEILAGLDA